MRPSLAFLRSGLQVAALMLLIGVADGALPVQVLDAALGPPPPGGGKLWVLLVAGSSGYTNYRHQADVCHAYQAVHGRGVPKEQIIVMIFDDVAKSFFNTRKGALYNEPGGPDVYAGVPKDYTKRSITPKNFLAVLSGDREAMQEVPGSGRVIESGPNDRIFVYFADHGAPGMLAFPSKFVVVPTKLLARDLIRTIEDMHAADRFSQMLIYVEACESGSMFHGLLKPDLGVLAVTAASPVEPSMACYYNNTLGTFLGDCFSNHWLEHQDASVAEDQEAVADNVAAVRSSTNTSHVCVYGDLSVAALPAASFLGQGDASLASRTHPGRRSPGLLAGPGPVEAVSSRQVTRTVLHRRLLALEAALSVTMDGDGGVVDGAAHKSSIEDLEQGLAQVRDALQREQAAQEAAQAAFSTIAAHLAGNDSEARQALLSPHAPAPGKDPCTDPKPVMRFDCLERVLGEYEAACGYLTDSTLEFAGVLQRACDSGHTAAAIAASISAACPPAPTALRAADGAQGSCKAAPDESACMAMPACTWCKCAAVPSKCYTRKQAAKLPPAIFTCDP